MSIERVARAGGVTRYRVRWRQEGRNRARTFDRRRDAERFETEVRRSQQLGGMAVVDGASKTLDDYVADVWAPTYGPQLAPKTRRHYAGLYDHHLAPHLGALRLRELTPERITRWQSDRIAAGAGRVAVRHALDLLGSILERAHEADRIAANPVRRVRRAPRGRRDEVRPLAPATIEAMRAASSTRDATLIAVLAYAGLRPGEALALRWGDVREQTILVQRAASLGEEADTKTRQHRTVRLLSPLAADLRAWRLASGHADPDALVFPSAFGTLWTEPAYQSWRRRAFRRALDGAEVERARPYDLRHSFASLLLHEGRSVIYVARQLGHDARLTLTRYGHVIDELEDAPRLGAEDAIRAARAGDVPVSYPRTA